jgi:hypothetical protein
MKYFLKRWQSFSAILFTLKESIKFDFENCPASAPSPSGQITFCNKSQRATFLAEEHLPVGADQGTYAFLN